MVPWSGVFFYITCCIIENLYVYEKRYINFYVTHVISDWILSYIA